MIVIKQKPTHKRTVSKRLAIHKANPDAWVASVSVNFASKEFPYGWAQIFPGNILVDDANVVVVTLKKAKPRTPRRR